MIPPKALFQPLILLYVRPGCENPLFEYKIFIGFPLLTFYMSRVFIKRLVLILFWQQAIAEELQALEKSHTWDMVDLPRCKTLFGCKWLYNIKSQSDGSVEL